MGRIACVAQIPRFSLLSHDDLDDDGGGGGGDVFEALWYHLFLQGLGIPFQDGMHMQDVFLAHDLQCAPRKRGLWKVVDWDAFRDYLSHCADYPAALLVDSEYGLRALLACAKEGGASAGAPKMLILKCQLMPFRMSAECERLLGEYLKHPATQHQLRYLDIGGCQSNDNFSTLRRDLRDAHCEYLRGLILDGESFLALGRYQAGLPPNITALGLTTTSWNAKEDLVDSVVGADIILARLTKLLVATEDPDQPDVLTTILKALKMDTCQIQILHLRGIILPGTAETGHFFKELRLHSLKELGLFSTFRQHYVDIRTQDWEYVPLLNALVKEGCTLKALHFCDGNFPPSMEMIQKILESQQISLSGLHVADCMLDTEDEDQLSQFSQALKNSSLRRLKLCGCKIGAPLVAAALEDMLGLTLLDLSETTVRQGSEMFLIEALEKNFHLVNFNYRWEDRGRAARCDALLERNRSFEKGGLLEHGFVKPRIGRLFLCGHQTVGKTSLRTGLRKAALSSSDGSSSSSACLPMDICPCEPLLSWVGAGPEERTRGIEMETLKFGGDQLVVCDLAGQKEYHAFHHFFLIGAVKDLFIIVCRYETDQVKFESKLRYWLRFICSHCSSISIRPTVMLVLNFFPPNHCGEVAYMTQTAEERTSHLREEFKGALDFCPVFGVVATSKAAGHFAPIAESIESFLQRNRTRLIPRLCDELASLLSAAAAGSPSTFFPRQTKRSKVIFLPLLEVMAAYEQNFSSRLANRDGFVAALKELHNEGQVVYFHVDGEDPENQTVIVDCSWFSNVLMGALLEPESLKSHWVRKSCSERWIVRIEEVRDILRKHKQCEPKTLNQLLKYLEKMELLYPVDGQSERLLVPALLGTAEEVQLHWQESESSHIANRYIYFGRRLRCKDTVQALLPSGIFCRLQVKLHGIYKHEIRSFKLGDGWICFVYNNVKAIVRYGGKNEQWEDKQWIDIMVRREKTPGDQMEATAEKIVRKVADAIAEIHSAMRPLGGVQLEEMVMRAEMVEALGTSSVDVESLSTIKDKIRKEGFEYSVSWEDGSTPILQLLWSSEVSTIFEQHSLLVKSIAEELNVNVAPIDVKAGTEKDVSQELETCDRTVLSSIDAEFMWLDKRNKGRHEQLLEKISDVVKRLEKVERRILRSCSSLLVGGPLPSLPYLSDKAGRLQKLKDLIVGDEGVMFPQLHFMCESPHDRPHAVEGQKGVSVFIPPESFPSVAPFLMPAIMLICCVARFAANVYRPTIQSIIPTAETLAASLGWNAANVVGDNFLLPALEAYSEEMPNRELLMRKLRSGQSERLNSSEWQMCLMSLLKGKDIDMLRDFKLYKVQYDKELGDIAWVCHKHIDEGIIIHHNGNPFKANG